MSGYSKETEQMLTEEIANSVKRARETGMYQSWIAENDECHVRITARPDGTFSLQHNYGMLARRFAQIAAEVEAENEVQ